MSVTNVPSSEYSSDDGKDTNASVVGHSKDIFPEDITEEREDSDNSRAAGYEINRKTDTEEDLDDSSDKSVTFGIANLKIDSDVTVDENTGITWQISKTDVTNKEVSTDTVDGEYPMEGLPSTKIVSCDDPSIELRKEEIQTGTKDYEADSFESNATPRDEYMEFKTVANYSVEGSVAEAETTYFAEDTPRQIAVAVVKEIYLRKNDKPGDDYKTGADVKKIVFCENDRPDDDDKDVKAVTDQEGIVFMQEDLLDDNKVVKAVTEEEAIVFRQEQTKDNVKVAKIVTDHETVCMQDDQPDDVGTIPKPLTGVEEIVLSQDDQPDDESTTDNLKNTPTKKRKLTPRMLNRMKKLLLRKLHSSGDKDFYIGDLLEAVESELMDLPRKRVRQRSNKQDTRPKTLTKKRIRSINSQRRKHCLNMEVLASSMSEEFVDMEAILDKFRQVSTDFNDEFKQPNTPIGEPYSADLRMKELFVKTKQCLPKLQDSFKEVKHCLRMFVKTDRTLTDDLHNAFQTYFGGSILKAKQIPRVRYSEVLKILKNSNRQHCYFEM